MPGEPELLSSGESRSAPGRRLGWWAGLVALGLVGVAIALSGGPDAGTTPATGTTATDTTAAPAPATSATPVAVAPEDLVAGSLPSIGLPPGGGTAIQAARSVVGDYCERIDSWRIQFEGATGDFTDVVLLLTPSGTAYRSVVIRLHLTWSADHFNWAGSRSELDACP